jgi:branched-chain amino acid transport system permease protein
VITLQAAVTGALVGGLYALMAAGLSATWGVLRVINLAHFGLILIGAYLTYQVATSWGLDPIATLLVSAPVLFVAGALLQGAYDRLGVAGFNSLLMSFGLLIVIIQVATNIWTADFQRMAPDVNRYATGGLPVGRLILPTPSLVAFVLAVALIGGGYLALQRTFVGRGMRAFAEDRTVAAAFGIDHRRLGLLLGGLSGASAAVAGMVFALSNSITPTTPYEWFGTVFAVVILGGVGNLLGTLVAGVGIGVLSGLVSVIWSPSTEPFALFLAVILALLVRPQGLFRSVGAQ